MFKNRFVYLFFIVLIGSGCSKYGYVNLNYPLAPEAYLPDQVNTLALVNRSLVKEEDKQGKVIESVLTGEVAGSDRLASDECLNGVLGRMNGYRGINLVIPEQVNLYGTGTSKTPGLLDWQLVKSICNSTKADALLVLETFDSNSDLLVSTLSRNINSVLQGGKPGIAPPNQIRMNVTAFWRLYDPATQSIIDHQSKSFLTFNGTGSNYMLLPPDALPRTAYQAGEEYIQRFLPGYYTVKRDMYKKGKGPGKEAFKTAFRRTEMANWQEAIDAWTELVRNSGRETAGRACLNIAVSHEVLGNTDLALQWVKRSYEEYQDKLGRAYAKILMNRRHIEYGD
ncbi:DUF6340 family protein [Gaoshiqia sp. Z1-71]|uniref:DUF6340 family protein n=1 Tax=Gaoshiqia hydrogeniformans TaxID=3290090 RepID=UPI003BF7DA05